MPWTFFRHGLTPCGVRTRPKCFLVNILFGLNFSPASCSLSTVSNEWMLWCSSVDPCTFTSSAHGNVQGMSARSRLTCPQKISEEADSPKGRRTKSYFLNGVLNALRSWLFSSSCQWSNIFSFHQVSDEGLAIPETANWASSQDAV